MEKTNCWNCGYQQKGTAPLLGHCWGWLKERGGPQELKAKRDNFGYLVDSGCSRWTETEWDFKELAKLLNGELPEANHATEQGDLFQEGEVYE